MSKQSFRKLTPPGLILGGLAVAVLGILSGRFGASTPTPGAGLARRLDRDRQARAAGWTVRLPGLEIGG